MRFKSAPNSHFFVIVVPVRQSFDIVFPAVASTDLPVPRYGTCLYPNWRTPARRNCLSARPCSVKKGDLKQANAQRDRGIQDLRSDPQFDSYLMAMCSLMLMVVLVVGATGYASIQGLLSSATIAAKAAPVENDHLDRATRPDRIVTHAGLRRPA
jgi:hypothetical protein